MDNLEKLKNILEEMDDLFLRVEIQQIKSEHKIIEDIGIDSLTRVSLFYEITDAFNVDKDEMDAASWITISDIVEYMDSLS